RKAVASSNDFSTVKVTGMEFSDDSRTDVVRNLSDPSWISSGPGPLETSPLIWDAKSARLEAGKVVTTILLSYWKATSPDATRLTSEATVLSISYPMARMPIGVP